MSPKITTHLLKGNYAEHLATHILSRTCLVRPIVGNSDIGVDLYCESVIRGEPFLHFWVQVKARRYFPNQRQTASCKFRTDSLKYWARQPVPVIAFLVPINWPPEKINIIHVIDITLATLVKGIDTNRKFQSLESTPSLALALDVQNEESLDSQIEGLLVHHLPMTVSAMYSDKGFLYPAPKPAEEYIKYFSGHVLHRSLEKVDRRMRDAATFGIMQLLNSGGNIADIPESLVAVLKSIKDDKHYQVFEARGLFKMALGHRRTGSKNFRKALECIERDPNVDRETPPWPEIIERLNNRISSLK